MAARLNDDAGINLEENVKTSSGSETKKVSLPTTCLPEQSFEWKRRDTLLRKVHIRIHELNYLYTKLVAAFCHR